MRRFTQLLWLVMLICGLRVTALMAEEAASTTQLSISSISIQGTNLNLIALVPPGLDRVALEISGKLGGDWGVAAVADAPAGAPQLTFTIPKPADPMAFFRLNGKRLKGERRKHSIVCSFVLPLAVVTSL